MYNMNNYNNPMQQPVNYQSQGFGQQQQPSEAQQQLQQAFTPTANYNVSDSNSNQTYQQFQPASTQFNMPSMPLQTFEAYPQVQTQINLHGLPPLTVNTPRIDPTKYS